ncbi:hypothetical protein C8F01DRAFT_1080647 [Mycena amicta]|nr:hypothetical protein C8F01DRAFT_1080647 [Mycena amicta]
MASPSSSLSSSESSRKSSSPSGGPTRIAVQVQKKTRRAVACLNCRHLKAKCVSSTNTGPACTRCKMRNVPCEYPSAQPTTGIYHRGLNYAREWPDPYLPYVPAPQTNLPPRYSRTRSSPYPSLSLQHPQPHWHWQSSYPYPYPSGGNVGDSGLHGSRHWISPGCWASDGVSRTIQPGGGTGSGNVMSNEQRQGFGWLEGRTGDAGWGCHPKEEDEADHDAYDDAVCDLRELVQRLAGGRPEGEELSEVLCAGVRVSLLVLVLVPSIVLVEVREDEG